MAFAQYTWYSLCWLPSCLWCSMATSTPSVSCTSLSTMTFFSECFVLSQKTVTHSPYFYSVHSICCLVAGISLLWVAALGAVVLYIYAVISFAFLHESVNDLGENKLYCDTLSQCLISVIRWGLIDNLGHVCCMLGDEWQCSGASCCYGYVTSPVAECELLCPSHR